jgi:hypothetical protein
MFILSHIQYNRKVAAFLYHTQNNIKIIRNERKKQNKTTTTTGKLT